MKIKLKNDTIITVLESTTPTAIKATFDNVYEMDNFRSELSKDNLSEFQYMNDDDTVIGNYENYVLVMTHYTVSDDLHYNASFEIRQLSDTEIRLNNLEESQETQNGAIEELASIVGGE